ncbi:MAG: nicotinate phosphoribosyltransferase [Deltaproteobacteria bacterium]|nr:nicotinate phosphoribosyltransferase [Deltaproteobacteria bacterium]
MNKREFNTAGFDDIKSGKVTDVYFERTLEILKAKGINKRVKMEFRAKKLPRDWEWGILAGIDECARLLEGENLSVRALPEGSLFRAFDPVMEMEGQYNDFGLFETALLGLICQASGIATMAARCKKTAGERQVISFGARRMHPAISPMIERSAFIGGCDGVAVVKSAQCLGEEPVGTMPHALILIMGDSVTATKAFHEVIDPAIKRVALVDTIGDEKFEALGCAEALGEDLFAVRLDTPGSRKGNFRQIFEEVRWELNLNGYEHVKLFASGGIDEYTIAELNPVVDAYGVGTSISAAPVIDFSLDIMEIEGVPFAKRGKMSGSKSLLRCSSCENSLVVPYPADKVICNCGGIMTDRLCPLIRKGVAVCPKEEPRRIRERVLKEVAKLEKEVP